MYIDFAAILGALGPDAGFKIANQVTPGNEYLYASLLPEVPGYEYTVNEGYMTVRSMMAGMVGMDSPYPPTGFVETRTEQYRTIKVANKATLPEAVLRQLQHLMAASNPSPQALAQEVLNFYSKVVIQPHFDTAEWLRMQALINGRIQWTFGDSTIDVNYNIPAAHKLTAHTGADAYNGATSQFWPDVQKARSLLRYNMQYAIAHPQTIDNIIGNSVHQLQLLAQDSGGVTIQRLVGTTERPDTDIRYTLRLISYDLEGEVFDTDTTGATFKIPFMPPGKILFVGSNQYDRTYRVGLGSTIPADFDQALGYTHMAPTVEAGNRPGRWGRMFVPEPEPWQLTAEGVTNLLPIIDAPDKLVIATTTVA